MSDGRHPFAGAFADYTSPGCGSEASRLQPVCVHTLHAHMHRAGVGSPLATPATSHTAPLPDRTGASLQAVAQGRWVLVEDINLAPAGRWGVPASRTHERAEHCCLCKAVHGMPTRVWVAPPPPCARRGAGGTHPAAGAPRAARRRARRVHSRRARFPTHRHRHLRAGCATPLLLAGANEPSSSCR